MSERPYCRHCHKDTERVDDFEVCQTCREAMRSPDGRGWSAEEWRSALGALARRFPVREPDRSYWGHHVREVFQSHVWQAQIQQLLQLDSSEPLLAILEEYRARRDEADEAHNAAGK
jgi:hypothetical protein